MKIEGAVVFVTGGNRGIGRALVDAALARGARKVYAAMRSPDGVVIAGAQTVRLDVTDAVLVSRAARECHDTTLLINNAGIAQTDAFLDEDSEASIRHHMETNVYGVLRMSRAFAPVLGKNGGGGLMNVLSVASFLNGPRLAGYGLSKSAAWALTNGLRRELSEQRTQVIALHMGFVDTELARDFDFPKMSPAECARLALDGVEAGAEEVLAGVRAVEFKQGLTATPPLYLQV